MGTASWYAVAARGKWRLALWLVTGEGILQGPRVILGIQLCAMGDSVNWRLPVGNEVFRPAVEDERVVRVSRHVYSGDAWLTVANGYLKGTIPYRMIGYTFYVHRPGDLGVQNHYGKRLRLPRGHACYLSKT